MTPFLSSPYFVFKTIYVIHIMKQELKSFGTHMKPDVQPCIHGDFKPTYKKTFQPSVAFRPKTNVISG